MASKTLLNIVSRGNSIICEINRLGKVQEPLLWTDRFFGLFESIYLYIKDLIKFIEWLDNGVFIQESLETFISSPLGLQLLTESVYLYGVMLLQLDFNINCSTRSNLIHQYIVKKGSKLMNVPMDEIMYLCKDTGLKKEKDQWIAPPYYPIAYFQRFHIPFAVISLLIGKLKAFDIYNQEQYFPLPQHRTLALSSQASILTILLFFDENILKEGVLQMKEIVARHFVDNHVVDYYMGNYLDLKKIWSIYPAANEALKNTLEISHLETSFNTTLETCNQKILQLLMEGVLTDEYILQYISRLLSLLREANHVLRWKLLHQTPIQCWNYEKLKSKQLNSTPDLNLIWLMLNTAQLEFLLKNRLKIILQAKLEKCRKYQKLASDRMFELSNYFSGTIPLTRVSKSEHLQTWFANLANRIDSLVFTDEKSTENGRMLIQLMQALEEVQEFHQLESNLNAKTFIEETRNNLSHLIRLLNAKDHYRINLNIISDFAYAWKLLPLYIPQLQALIQKDPLLVIRLRALFVKMSSVLDFPLVRINEAQSPDLISVSQYYSGELVSFVQNVVQIIPESIFRILGLIIQLETNHLPELPTRLEKENLALYEKAEARLELAKHSYDISILTQAMQTTLVGVIEIKSKDLLHQGIRNELANRIFQSYSLFLNDTTLLGVSSSFDDRLMQVQKVMDGLSRSIEYLQDYIKMNGMQIWEQEIDTFWSNIIDPKELQTSSLAKNVLCYLMKICWKRTGGLHETKNWSFWNREDSKQTIYVPKACGFYSIQKNNCTPEWTSHHWMKLGKVIGVSGLSLMNYIFGILKKIVIHSIYSSLNGLFSRKDLSPWLLQIRNDLTPFSTLSSLLNSYSKISSTVRDYLSSFVINIDCSIIDNEYVASLASSLLYETVSFNDALCDLGRWGFLRKGIQNCLSIMCKAENQQLSFCIDAVSSALLLENIETWPKELEETLFAPVSELVARSGINASNPFDINYIQQLDSDRNDKEKNLTEVFSVFMFFHVLSECKDFMFESNHLFGKFDVIAWGCGISVLFYQLPKDNMNEFVLLISQYMRSCLNNEKSDYIILMEFMKSISVHTELVANVISLLLGK